MYHKNELLNSHKQKSTIRNRKEMEVHHHPKVEKKKFKEYFLEFLMIFIAVTLGFFAESYREYLNDRSKEKEYIQSFIQDLASDTSQIDNLLGGYARKHKAMDTLLSELKKPASLNHPDLLYKYLMYNKNVSFLQPADGTLEQLKNGGLRLIRNHAISDSIIAYSLKIKVILIHQNDLDISFHHLSDISSEIFDENQEDDFLYDRSILPQPERTFLLTKDPAKINVLFNEESKMLYAEKFHEFFLNDLKATATRYVIYLKKEYHIK